MNIKSYLWTFPFLSFFLGYFGLSLFMGSHSITTPNLLGYDIGTAAQMVSDANLHINIIGKVEDADREDGCIILQTPKPGQTIKSNQSIYCTITKRPTPQKAPCLLQKRQAEIEQSVNQRLRINTYQVPSINKEGMCIGQTPNPDELVNEKIIIAYFARPHDSLVLFPKITGKMVSDVKTWLQPYGFKVEIIHRNALVQHENCNCTVLEQRPLSGTFIDLKKPILIQLIV